MKLIDVTRRFNTEDKCLDYLEQMRWPNGDLCCIHCGVMNVSKITREKKGKNQRTRIYQCLEKECGKQFSATSGRGGAPSMRSGGFGCRIPCDFQGCGS
jgi:hypothetical protein